MFRQTVRITVTACFLFYTGCAPVVSEVHVKDSEYHAVKGVGKLFVTTKDGKQHEVVQFEFTETHLVGNQLFSKARTEPIEIRISDIDSVKIKGVRDTHGEIITDEEIEKNITTNRRTAMAILGVIGFGALAFIPSCAFAFKIAGESGEHSDLATFVFFGLEIGAMVLGGHLGYKGGKNTDKRKAIEKIQQDREKQKDKDR